MVRIRTLTTGVLMVALLAAGVAFAQGPRGGRAGRGMMGPGAPGMALAGLDLTDAQRQQVREIRERYRDQVQAAAQRLREATDKQRQAVETIPVDEALITSATQDLAQAQTDVAIQQARVNAEIWAVLTPEQQAQATKMRADRRARMEERRQQHERRQDRR